MCGVRCVCDGVGWYPYAVCGVVLCCTEEEGAVAEASCVASACLSVGSYPEYTLPLVDHLVTVKSKHWDKVRMHPRACTAAGIGWSDVLLSGRGVCAVLMCCCGCVLCCCVGDVYCAAVLCWYALLCCAAVQCCAAVLCCAVLWSRQAVRELASRALRALVPLAPQHVKDVSFPSLVGRRTAVC